MRTFSKFAFLFAEQYTDSSGRIAINTFEDIVEMHRESIPEKVIRKLLEHADKNKDGYITADELSKLVSCNIMMAKRSGS